MQTVIVSGECAHLGRRLPIYAFCLLYILILLPFESLFFSCVALFPAFNETSVRRIIKRNFLIIKENMSRSSLAFAIFFPFSSLLLILFAVPIAET